MMGNISAAALGVPIQDLAKIFGKIKVCRKANRRDIKPASRKKCVPAIKALLAAHLGVLTDSRYTEAW